MKNQTFYEYDVARDEFNKEIKLPNIFENEDARKFELFLKKKHLEKVFNISQTSIQAQSYVGVIKYKKYQFEILPKFLKYKDDGKDQETILKNLFYMLSYTKKLEIKESDIAKLSKCDNPFLEVLIGSYANSLYDSLLRFIPKNYVLNEDNLSFLKGKLKFNENIRYNTVNKAKFYCEFDEFCEDNLLNKLFLFVSLMLLKITTSKGNKKKLKQIINVYSEITFEQITSQKIINLKLNRNQMFFEKSFILAKMFIENASIEMSAKKIKSLTLLFDMNILFEEFIYELIRKNYNKFDLDSPSNVEYQRNRKLVETSERYKFEDGTLKFVKTNNTDCKSTFSDIVINGNLIIDTKYKYNSGSRCHFNNDDAYQILAYKEINSNDARKATGLLLYPQTEEDFTWIHYVDKNTDNKFFVSCVGFNLDIKKDLKNDNSEIINKLRELIKLCNSKPQDLPSLSDFSNAWHSH